LPAFTHEPYPNITSCATPAAPCRAHEPSPASSTPRLPHGWPLQGNCLVSGLCTRINIIIHKHPPGLGTHSPHAPPTPLRNLVPPPPTILYCNARHTILGVAISCKGQPHGPAVPLSGTVHKGPSTVPAGTVFTPAVSTLLPQRYLTQRPKCCPLHYPMATRVPLRCPMDSHTYPPPYLSQWVAPRGI